MKARPILFSAPMVRPLIDGSKTQTRRLVKPQPDPCQHRPWSKDDTPRWVCDDDGWHCSTCGNGVALARSRSGVTGIRCPYGVPGDLLYVRETWASDGQSGVRYYATDTVNDLRRKRVSIHMPRWASRLTLEITDVRVERLQDISEADAIAEGLTWIVPGKWSVDSVSLPVISDDPREAYFQLWECINGTGSRAANPWVWAVSFKVHRANVDQVLAAVALAEGREPA